MSIRQNGNIIAGASQYHPDLFDYKWADHILNDVQWLRADTFSWQDGSVYQAAYNHLVDDASSVATSITVLNTSLGLNEIYDRYSDGDITGYFAWILNGVVVYTESPTPSINDSAYVSFSPVKTFDIVSVAGLQSETVAGITIQFYLAGDGHKICPNTEASNVASIYLATGVAWYYIIDTVNERFKLPRINPEVVKKKDLPSTLSVGGNGSVIAVTAESADRSIYVDRSSSGSLRVTPNVGANASVYDIKNLIATVPSLTTHYAGGKYLYFYVGAFTQTALENTAGLNASLFNGKADLDFANTDMIDYVIEKQDPVAGNNYTWYRKYKSGWVEQGGLYTNPSATSSGYTQSLPVAMADANYQVTVSVFTSTPNVNYYAPKSSGRTTTSFVITPNASQVMWEVRGFAA